MRPSNAEIIEFNCDHDCFQATRLEKDCSWLCETRMLAFGKEWRFCRVFFNGCGSNYRTKSILRDFKKRKKLAAWMTILEVKNNSKELPMSNNSSSAMACDSHRVPNKVQRQSSNLLQTVLHLKMESMRALCFGFLLLNFALGISLLFLSDP